MLETILTRIGLPVLINIVGEALGYVDNPVTKIAADALKQVDDALKTGGLSQEQLSEANRHIERLAELKSKEYEAAIAQVNESLRAEIISQDKYVRRMRPTFGYLMAFTWAAQMFGVAYVIIFNTDKAGVVMASMGSLSAIWAVGLSVLGIYVYKRSEDKKILGSSSKEVIFWNDVEK